MPQLNIQVSNKVATYQKRGGAIVCGNSDYEIKFTFDDEWSANVEKFARFIWNGKRTDVKIDGDTCTVPLLKRTKLLKVGVYAKDIRTTTSAEILCVHSALCGDEPLTEEDQLHTSVAEEAAKEAEASAAEAKVSETNAATSAEAAKDYMETAQRVVTSSENLQAQIDRNSKRITNLEQGLTPDPFETDASVAYMKAVPATALPYAEIRKVGGMTVKDETTGALKSAPVTEVVSVGVNIWDEQWTLNESSRVSSKNYIPVKPNTRYYISQSPSGAMLFYDKSYKVVGEQYGRDFTTPSNAYYLMFALAGVYGTEYKNDVCLNVYDTAVNGKYYPYKEPSKLLIPEAVRALDGYGQSNPDNAEEYNHIDLERQKFVAYGHIADGSWVSFATVKETDISGRITADNFIEVGPYGTLTFENEHQTAVPSEIVYQLKEVTA